MKYSITRVNDNSTQILETGFNYVNDAISAALELPQDGNSYVIKQIDNEGEKPVIINCYRVEDSEFEMLEPLQKIGSWLPLNDEKMTFLGDIEFQDFKGEYHGFGLFYDDNFIVFGGACNTGLLQSGSFLIDKCFSLDENLQELLQDLESYYGENGKGYESDRFTCNDRM